MNYLFSMLKSARLLVLEARIAAGFRWHNEGEASFDNSLRGPGIGIGLRREHDQRNRLGL